MAALGDDEAEDLGEGSSQQKHLNTEMVRERGAPARGAFSNCPPPSPHCPRPP
jgi:hypothetical protein